MKGETCIHIGYPKCGSTTLQRNLLNKHSGINSFGIVYPFKKQEFFNDDIEYFSNQIRYFPELEFQECFDRKFIDEKIRSLVLQNKTNIFSNETFLAPFRSDNYLKAQRLKKCFPEAKIMIVIRNQADFLRSFYEMYPFSVFGPGKTGKYKTFDRWLKEAFEDPHTSILFAPKYYQLATHYKNLFDKKNIGIFLFEEMVNDTETFSRKIASFLGIDKKETLQLLSQASQNPASEAFLYVFKKRFLPDIEYKKYVDEKIYNFSCRQISKLRKKPEMSDYWKQKIIDYYKESNRQLAEEFNLDLSKYNYPL
ncbi:MAG: sulfotransferase domain-containing protein [Candidatus Moranbacteria bacterium]|nr:sulfotransferase domain-containing protein [Candidatus Moranbacteria bacterium]